MVVYELGEEMLRDSRIYGPVLMKRYTGSLKIVKRILKFGHLVIQGK